jgi:predicted metal-dependent hydrolase
VRESPTARTQRILREPTPDIVFAMLQKYQDVAQRDAADKVAMTIVRREKKPGKDAPVVEREITSEESIRFDEFPVLNESSDILILVDEAHCSHTRMLHRNLRKALPNAAIVSFTGTPILSREKVETREIFGDFIDKYVLQEAELEALPAGMLALPDDEVERLASQQHFLVRTYSQLAKLRALEIAAVFSGDHNDPESWWEWTDKAKQEERIRRFKRQLAPERTDKTDPLAILVVNNMLLTGFDAPVEQVLYLRKIIAHDLMQAIARVNRTCGQKKCGYVVDSIGVARHLHEALKDYDGEDTEGTLIDIDVELPKLLDRRARAVAVFADRGITDLQGQVDACVQLLEDLKIRADFINKLRMFYETLNVLEHRPEVPGDVFRDAKLLGFINKVAANLYRDPALHLFGVAEKVKALINAHISARGVDPKIPPTAITTRSSRRCCRRRRAAALLWVHRWLAAKERLTSALREPEFVSGESFSVLGRQYPLRIDPTQAEPLRFDGRTFHLSTPAIAEATHHFRTWFIGTGRVWVRERVVLLSRKVGCRPVRTDVRDLGYRWGSCGRNGVLYVNWQTIHQPVRLVDYVLVHELSHLIEPTHGPEFWKVVDRAMPDWRERRAELDRQASEVFWCTAEMGP